MTFKTENNFFLKFRPITKFGGLKQVLSRIRRKKSPEFVLFDKIKFKKFRKSFDKKKNLRLEFLLRKEF